MATELELNSFLTKFKQLCNAGFEASLQLNSKNGYATVSLEVKLGALQSSPNATQSSFKQKRRRSPAYYRRQEARRNAAITVNNSTTAAE